jgi:hypothetical protein
MATSVATAVTAATATTATAATAVAIAGGSATGQGQPGGKSGCRQPTQHATARNGHFALVTIDGVIMLEMFHGFVPLEYVHQSSAR